MCDDNPEMVSADAARKLREMLGDFPQQPAPHPDPPAKVFVSPNLAWLARRWCEEQGIDQQLIFVGNNIPPHRLHAVRRGSTIIDFGSALSITAYAEARLRDLTVTYINPDDVIGVKR